MLFSSVEAIIWVAHNHSGRVNVTVLKTQLHAVVPETQLGMPVPHSQWELTLCKRNMYILLHVMLGAQPAQPTQLGNQESLLDHIRGICILLHVILCAQPAQLLTANATACIQCSQRSWGTLRVSSPRSSQFTSIGFPIPASQLRISTDCWACWCSWQFWFHRAVFTSGQFSGVHPRFGARGQGIGPTLLRFLSGCCPRWPGGRLQQSCKMFPSPSGNRSDSLHRCVQYWLRSPVRVTLNYGTLVQIPKLIPHQHLGDAGHNECSQRVSATSLVPDHASDVRQCHSCYKGGTRSYTLMQLSMSLIKWCNLKAIMLVPVHLPGMQCQLPGLGWVSCMCSCHSSWSHKSCTSSVTHQECGWS